MKIGEIDYNLKTPKRSLFLCKPNKSIIAKINEAYDIQYYTKLGTVNELSFKIPTIIIKDDVPMDNPNIVRIKNRYLFKFVVGGITEYFLFNESNKVYGDDEYIEYRAYSLGSQLSDKNVREFELYGNLKVVAEKLLEDVYGDEFVPLKRWKIDYVDSYFVSSDTAERTYTVSSMSLLEVIYDMATNWNAVIKWDTKNLTISFYKAENVGLNKGFYIRDGKYLENFNLQIDTSSTITRLRAFGSDGLTFREINPLGENFIQDFSFYMYPFEYDKATGKVTQSSDYMSDELCIALTKYSEKMKSMQEKYEVLSKTVSALQAILTKENETLQHIIVKRMGVENERDILLAEFQKDKGAWGTNGFNRQGTKEGTPAHADIIRRLRAKEIEESVQKTAVLNAEMYLNDAKKKKQDHLDELAPFGGTPPNFTVDEWSELQQFVIEKEYTNDSITREEALLEEAKTVFKQNQEPAIKLTVGIIDFLSVIECQNDWDKLGLGDSIRIRYDRLKVNILAKIIEINYDFENFNITLTIANEKDLKDGSEQLMDLLNKADLTSTIVSMDKSGWNLSKENNGKINDLINNKWDALKQAVLAGYDQQITISERGIIVKSLDDPNSWLVIQNGFLAITNDAGNTWKHAISKDGIWGEYIFGKVISGVNLYIEDESGAWKTQGSRTTIYNKDGKEVMWLGLVSDNARDQFDNILRGEEAECFGLVSWNDATKVELTDCKGFAISRWGNKYTDDNSYDWEKVLWADTNGTLYARDLVAQSLKIVNNIGETILDAETNYFNIGLLQNIVADGKLTTLEKLQIVTELYKIHTDYKQLLDHAEKYVKSERDDTREPDGAYDDENGFTTKKSTFDRYSTQPLIQAYSSLMDYISAFIPVQLKGITLHESLSIDVNNSLMEQTSEINDRGQFIEKFRNYWDESTGLKEDIENAIFYSGIQMGKYYNNVIIDEHGFIAVRSDGKYRAFLNATNGLALQKWETKNGVLKWVDKLYASVGHSEYTDGTLIAEELVAKKLRIETVNDEVLLDMDSLNINFAVLDSILYDDVIVSIEKEALLAEYNSITAQVQELNTQLDKYINEVYSDRDTTYYGLDSAKTKMEQVKVDLNSSHLALKTVLDKVFMNMTLSTFLSTDLGLTREQFVALFENLYASFEIARNSIENFLEKSSLQLGRNYNNTVIDAQNGIRVYRGNMEHMVEMNATVGFSLSRNDGTAISPIWTKLFWVDTDGDLYAQDITATNITTNDLHVINGNIGEAITLDEGICEGIIVTGQNGEVVTLNGCIGLKIEVNGDKRIWIAPSGDIYAKRLFIMGDDSDEILEDIDGSYISDLTVNKLITLNRQSPQDIVHIQDSYIKLKTDYLGGEKTKFKLSFNGSGSSAYPEMVFGEESGNELGKIYKDGERFAFEYSPPNFQSKIWLNQTDSDDEGQAMYLHSTGGVRLDSAKKVVMRTSETEYIRVVAGEDVAMKKGEATVIIKSDQLLLQFDSNNFIKIDSSGVTVKGTRIDLN